MSTSPSSFLLVPEPRVQDIPPSHPLRAPRQTLHRATIYPASDKLYREWPQLHPANLPLWDVEEAFPPYKGSKIAPRFSWPRAAVYIKETACYGARGVFPRPVVLENGDLYLGQCFEHLAREGKVPCPYERKILPYLGPRPKAKENVLPEAPAVQSSERSSSQDAETSAAPVSSPVQVSPSSVAASGTSSTIIRSSQASQVSAVGGPSGAAASRADVQGDIEPSTTSPGTSRIVSLDDSTRDTVDLVREAGREESRRIRESETDIIDARRKTPDRPTQQVFETEDDKNNKEGPLCFASLKKVHAIELAQLDRRYQSELEALKKKHSEELEYRIRLADQVERANDADKQRLAELQKWSVHESQEKDGSSVAP